MLYFQQNTLFSRETLYKLALGPFQEGSGHAIAVSMSHVQCNQPPLGGPLPARGRRQFPGLPTMLQQPRMTYTVRYL